MSGYTGTTIDAEILTGSITNRGAIEQSALNASGSYTIPSGYHNGSGIITTNSLSSQTSADATTSDILSTYTGWVNGSQVTGNMANQGAKSSSLNADGSYTIPAGYHNGSGIISANSLSSQTSATATAAYIVSGQTAWVNGSKITGTLACQAASSWSATPLSTSSIRISWKNPANGPFQGVFIQYSTSSYPGSSGGTRIYTGTGSSTTAGGTSYTDITGLSMGTTYYFTCTSYVNNLGWAGATNVSAKTIGTLILCNDRTSNYTWKDVEKWDSHPYHYGIDYGVFGYPDANFDFTPYTYCCLTYEESLYAVGSNAAYRTGQIQIKDMNTNTILISHSYTRTVVYQDFTLRIPIEGTGLKASNIKPGFKFRVYYNSKYTWSDEYMYLRKVWFE